MNMLLTGWNPVQSEVQKKLSVRLKNSSEMQKTELKCSRTRLNSVSRTKPRIKLKTQLRILFRNHLKMLPKNPLKNLSEQHIPKHSTEGEKIFVQLSKPQRQPLKPQGKPQKLRRKQHRQRGRLQKRLFRRRKLQSK